MKRMKNGSRLFGILLCVFLFGVLSAVTTPVFAEAASFYAGCQAMTSSGCAGGTTCQAACGSDTSCATSGTAGATTGTDASGTAATNTKYAAANTTQSSNKSDGAAAVGLAVAAGVIAAAVIGFFILNRKPTRR